MDINVERPSFSNREFNILDFGAKSDFEFNNQKAIQSAIDECFNQGGGKVVIPNGYYVTGPIELKSNVNLFVDRAAFVQFTKSKEEYPLMWANYEGMKRIRAKSPISAYKATNIAITGHGVMDGAGDLWRGIKEFKLTPKQWQNCLKKSPYVIETKETKIWCPTKTYYDGVLKGEVDYNDPNALELASENFDIYRPVFVSLVKCDKVLLEDITLQNSPAWNVHPLFCTNFTMNRCQIRNKFYAQNGDGIDLESCQNCEISNSVFEVGDDGICLKSGKNKEGREIKIPTKNVYIHDCKVFDAHGGIVIGSEMSRGISNVVVENCLFNGTDVGIRFKSAIGRGGVVEDIVIKDIYMNKIVGEAMIFTMGYVLANIEDENERNKNNHDPEDYPEFRNILVENVLCDGAKIAFKGLGLNDHSVYNITVKNSKIKANEAIDAFNTRNICFENVTICTPKDVYHFDKEIFDDKKL